MRTHDPVTLKEIMKASSRWEENESAINELKRNRVTIIADASMAGANLADLATAFGYSRQYITKMYGKMVKDEIRKRLERL